MEIPKVLGGKPHGNPQGFGGWKTEITKFSWGTGPPVPPNLQYLCHELGLLHLPGGWLGVCETAGCLRVHEPYINPIFLLGA